jgi:hypothetical protein
MRRIIGTIYLRGCVLKNVTFRQVTEVSFDKN